MSADSITQWAQACIDDEAITGMGYPLGRAINIVTLQNSYMEFCRRMQLHPANLVNGFGKACAVMFGPRRRLTAQEATALGILLATGKRPPWGYDVPDAAAWQQKIDEDRIGININSFGTPKLSASPSFQLGPTCGPGKDAKIGLKSHLPHLPHLFIKLREEEIRGAIRISL